MNVVKDTLLQGPDWYDVFNQNIYGTGNMDINVIVRIIHADKKLKQIMQRKLFHLVIIFFLIVLRVKWYNIRVCPYLTPINH